MPSFSWKHMGIPKSFMVLKRKSRECSWFQKKANSLFLRSCKRVLHLAVGEALFITPHT
ncbi:hypothetical protein BC829DRAFT_396516, partial [Chytridium lagenaria]